MLLYELKDMSEVNQCQREMNQKFAALGMTVTFTRHFIHDRLLGSQQLNTVDEIVGAFAQMVQKYSADLEAAKEIPGYQCILKDYTHELNYVLGINAPDQFYGRVPRHAPPGSFQFACQTIHAKPCDQFVPSPKERTDAVFKVGAAMSPADKAERTKRLIARNKPPEVDELKNAKMAAFQATRRLKSNPDDPAAQEALAAAQAKVAELEGTTNG